MRTLAVGVALALALSGCAALGLGSTSVRIDRGQLALMYADLSRAYGGLAGRLADACKSGKLDQVTCEEAARVNAQLAQADAEIRRLLSSTGTEDFDPAMLTRFLDLLARLAPLAAGGIKL